MIASTPSEDAYNEILEQKWDLKRFAANPVFLFMHDHDDVIGHAENVRVEDGVLKARLVFATEEVCELAEKVWRKVKAKLLRGISVGFKTRSYRWESINERDVLVLSDNELFEISIVSIPANPDTLIEQRKKSFGIARPAAPLKEKSMKELELLAKSAGCQADVDSLLAHIGKQNKFVEVTCSALGLEPSASHVDVVKSVTSLTAKSAEATKLAERIPSLEAAVKSAEEAAAEREVGWVIHCGIKGVFGIKADEKSRKSLMALRKVSPEDFADDFKVALDALKNFDNLNDYKPLTSTGGALAEDKAKSVSTAHDDADHEDAVETRVKQILKENPKLSRLQALALVGRDSEENQ